MSGHSKWSQIKHKKGVVDQKRSRLFSKLLNTISIASREEPNPQFNPKLKAAVERARQSSVPQNAIEKAIKKAELRETNLEEITIEAYGPGGIALIIEAFTDNKNRTIQEIKTLLKKHEGRFGEPGSVRWAFAQKDDGAWKPKFNQKISEKEKNKVEELTSDT